MRSGHFLTHVFRLEGVGVITTSCEKVRQTQHHSLVLVRTLMEICAWSIKEARSVCIFGNYLKNSSPLLTEQNESYLHVAYPCIHARTWQNSKKSHSLGYPMNFFLQTCANSTRKSLVVEKESQKSAFRHPGVALRRPVTFECEVNTLSNVLTHEKVRFARHLSALFSSIGP